MKTKSKKKLSNEGTQSLADARSKIQIQQEYFQLSARLGEIQVNLSDLHAEESLIMDKIYGLRKEFESVKEQ